VNSHGSDSDLEALDPRPKTAELQAVSIPEVRSLLALAVAAIVVAALYVAQDVLIPITLAVILSFVLSPLVNLLGRLGLWRGPAVLVSVLAALGCMGLIGLLIGNQAATLSADAPRYAETIERKVQRAQDFAASRVSAVAGLFPRAARVDRGPAATPVDPGAGAVVSVPSRTGPSPLQVEIAKPESSPFVVVRTVLTPVLGPLETTVIVIVVAIFILLQKEDLRDRVIRLFGTSDLNRTTMAMDEAGERLSRYFVSQLAVNAAFGLVIGIGLWAIGVPSPAVWGVLSGILRFVPYLGSILAALAPVALAAATDPGWSMAVYVALLFAVVEPLTGYVVEPLLYGHSTGLSPISVIVAAVFWTWIWGPIGLILSTPLTLCLVVVGRHVKSLEFFDVLLGDRPALGVVDRFYQRILANDPDEILDQAEAMLAGRTLLDYYDKVVMQGLKLAAQDEARGKVGPERAREINRLMIGVMDDLQDVVDAELTDGERSSSSALGQRSPVVACISGRGSFDDAVSSMLAQLLERAGIPVRRVPYSAVTRAGLADLDLSSVSVIALSYLQLTGSSAHLRYLIGRLRQRAPDATVIVGLWPTGELPPALSTTEKGVNADKYVSSLSEAIDAVRADLESRRSGRSASSTQPAGRNI
jgi:predicted PurR-regulated permease PerM